MAHRLLVLTLGMAVLHGPLGSDGPDRAAMEIVLDAWRDDSPSLRNEASTHALRSWRAWTDRDVETLRTAAQDPDPEVAQRARDALVAIEARRRAGDKAEEIDRLIEVLRTPEGKVECHMFVNPGGPIVEHSPAMRTLEGMGSAIEPLLLDRMNDSEIRSEIAVVLASIGGVDSVSALVASIPPNDTRHQSYWCVYSLWMLTGLEMGIDHKGFVPWDPQIGERWRSWYDENGPYLYVPEHPRHAATSWGHDRVLVDLEAKNAGVPREVYRRARTQVRYEDVSDWKETPEYAATLREFCVSLLIQDLYDGGHPWREAVLSLCQIDDPRARTAIDRLRKSSEAGSMALHDIQWGTEMARERDSPWTPERASEQRLADLRSYLKNDIPRVRVDAAETLWRLGQPDGLPVLIEALSLRPLEGENLTAVRRACEILGEVGDPAALPPLRALLKENLNGALNTGAGGMGWYGRPDARALARLGDREGIQYLEATIREGDPYGVVGRWPIHSEIEETGLKRFIPLVIPLLDSEEKNDRVHAARAIVYLLDHGH